MRESERLPRAPLYWFSRRHGGAAGACGGAEELLLTAARRSCCSGTSPVPWRRRWWPSKRRGETAALLEEEGRFEEEETRFSLDIVRWSSVRGGEVEKGHGCLSLWPACDAPSSISSSHLHGSSSSSLHRVNFGRQRKSFRARNGSVPPPSPRSGFYNAFRVVAAAWEHAPRRQTRRRGHRCCGHGRGFLQKKHCMATTVYGALYVPLRRVASSKFGMDLVHSTVPCVCLRKGV